MNSKVKRIINNLKNGKITMSDIPDEYELDPNIVKVERELGLRKAGHRGFDVLSQQFFVEEKYTTITFDTFEEYYHFLDGDIYNDSCYYQYDFKDKFSKNLGLDKDKLLSKKSFIRETIDNSLYAKGEIKDYKKNEKAKKKKTKEWIERFHSCKSYDQFQKTCNFYNRKNFDIDFFLFEYLFFWQSNLEQLDILKKYLWNDNDFRTNVILTFYLMNPSSDIINQYFCPEVSDNQNAKRKSMLRNFVKVITEGHVKQVARCYFDEETHFYCEKTTVFPCIQNDTEFYFIRSFETFDEFVEYRNGDLKNCDFSNVLDFKIDYTKYITDPTTHFAKQENDNLTYRVKKQYLNNKFIVEQYWIDKSELCIKSRKKEFTYFFDFVDFLNRDLSYADLLYCDKLINLSNTDGIILKNAKIRSNVCKKLGIPYTPFTYNKKLLKDFSNIEKNELEIIPDLHKPKELTFYNCSSTTEYVGRIDSEIAYVSDLHLLHRIINAGCFTKDDITYTLQKIVNNIMKVNNRFILIGGDTSSDFSIFELFVKILKKNNDCHEFIFILGNHELWPFQNLNLDDIIEKYRTLLQTNKMYLLHNDLLYYNENNGIKIIPFAELMSLDKSDILKVTQNSRHVIFGGTGFSGYNEHFNADSGIYQATINRSQEIQESKKFEQLYSKLTDVLEKRNTIIFTHMPKSDWCKNPDYHDYFVYISGHTHKNIFFDDGIQRIYADNQIGYKNENVHLKILVMDRDFDNFEHYKDGIYEISDKDYQEFYRGKNIEMTYTRETNILYMLKKKGFYCFIHQSESGSLTLLNGGSRKTLNSKDIQYYYDNMDYMIDSIKNPLDRYSIYQKNIANEIKKIGGLGQIHGCIIDIDYFNHIFVNPLDLTITSYNANDIINKHVYPNIPTLLERKCPELYTNYLKLIGSNQLTKIQACTNIDSQPKKYLKTDIYQMSRELKKMQKLNSCILTTWYEKPIKKIRRK